MNPNTNPTRNPRYDGWTSARQRAFLDLLRDGTDVLRASARLGMSRRSAYHLRRRDAGFATAWDAALREAREEKGRRLIAELVEIAPWARAAFAQGGSGGSGIVLPGQCDGVTSV